MRKQKDMASSKAWFIDQGFPASVFDRLVKTAGVMGNVDLGLCSEIEMKNAGLSLLQLRRFMKLQSEQLLGKASASKLETQIEELRKAVRSEIISFDSGKHILQAILTRVAKLTGASTQNLVEIEIDKWEIAKGKKFAR